MASQRRSDYVDRHVGMRLRSQRIQLRLSQADLGEKLGVTFQQIQKYEKGQNRLGASRLWHTAQIFGVPVNWFFEGLETDPAKIKQPEHDPFRSLVESPDGFKFATALEPLEHGPVRRQLLLMARALSEDEPPD